MFLMIHKDTFKSELHSTKGTLALKLGIDVRTLAKYIDSGKYFKEVFVIQSIELIKNKGKKREKTF